MRRCMIAALAVLVAASACSGPTERRQTDIVVTIDWSVASEPGFVDAYWELIRYDPGTGWRIDVDSGAIGTDGSATIRFQDECSESRDYSTIHRIRVSGHFAAHEGSSVHGALTVRLPALYSTRTALEPSRASMPGSRTMVLNSTATMPIASNWPMLARAR